LLKRREGEEKGGIGKGKAKRRRGEIRGDGMGNKGGKKGKGREGRRRENWKK